MKRAFTGAHGRPAGLNQSRSQAAFSPPLRARGLWWKGPSPGCWGDARLHPGAPAMGLAGAGLTTLAALPPLRCWVRACPAGGLCAAELTGPLGGVISPGPEAVVVPGQPCACAQISCHLQNAVVWEVAPFQVQGVS